MLFLGRQTTIVIAEYNTNSSSNGQNIGVVGIQLDSIFVNPSDVLSIFVKDIVAISFTVMTVEDFFSRFLTSRFLISCFFVPLWTVSYL